MIGSGIFIVDADIARVTNSPALYLGAWVVTAILTMIAALSYGELAAMMPRAGGQYVYLRESLGPLWGFLYGWTLFLVIQTGTIAAVCVAFGKFLGVFFPTISTTHWLWDIAHVPALKIGPMVLGNMEIGVSTANLTAIAVVFFLAIVNIFGVRLGALIQNIFTTAKALSLAGLILLAFTVGRNAIAWQANFGPGWSQFWKNAGWSARDPVQVGVGGPIVLVNLLVILAVVQVGSLFSADAWNNITFTAGEVKQPRRNIPLSLAAGTGLVTLLYVLANVAYLCLLPLDKIQSAPDDRVATAAIETVFSGAGPIIMAVAIMISTFGCNNGLILAGARVYYAMARDGLFFKATGKLNDRSVPAFGLVLQCLWTCLLVLPRTRLRDAAGAPKLDPLTGLEQYGNLYSNLLDYVVFAVLIFYVLTILGIFILRRKRPDAERPYRAFGYPVVPALYVVVASAILLALLFYKTQTTWPGLLIVLAGVPIYFLWKRRAPAAPAPDP